MKKEKKKIISIIIIVIAILVFSITGLVIFNIENVQNESKSAKIETMKSRGIYNNGIVEIGIDENPLQASISIKITRVDEKDQYGKVFERYELEDCELVNIDTGKIVFSYGIRGHKSFFERIPSNGVYQIRVSYREITFNYDENGNIINQDIIVYPRDVKFNVTALDEIPPTETLLSASTTSWTNQDVTLTGMAKDLGEHDSGIYKYQFSTDANLNASSEGWISAGTALKIPETTQTYIAKESGTYYFYAKDEAENVSRSNPITVKIEKIAPTVNLNPNGGKYVIPASGKATIKTTLTVADSGGSGLNTLQYAWNTSNTTEPTNWTTFTNGSEVSKADCTSGTYYLWTKVTDNAGNRASSIKISNAFIVQANIANPITFTYNPDKWTNGNVVATASTTITGFTLQTSKDGTNWNDTTNQTYASNGKIYARLKDSSGQTTNVITGNITNIDKIQPTISSITGNPTNWTAGNVTLVVNANDAESGLTAEAYSFDGGTTWQKNNTKTYTENTNGIEIKVKDNVGNIATANTIDITKIRRLSNISITSNPSKTNYYVGETLDTAGLVLELTYSNGDTETITKGFTCTPTTLNTIGTQSITLTYQDKNTTFNVKVEQKPTEPEQPEEIVLTSNKYSIEKDIIKKIQPKTVATIFKQNISTNASIIKLLQNNTEILDTGIIKTGMNILLENKTLYTLVVNGDCNGDGQANLQDILAINKHRLNKSQLTNEYLTAGDVNGDGKVDIRDLLQINKYRLEKIDEL